MKKEIYLTGERIADYIGGKLETERVFGVPISVLKKQTEIAMFEVVDGKPVEIGDFRDVRKYFWSGRYYLVTSSGRDIPLSSCVGTRGVHTFLDDRFVFGKNSGRTLS